MAIKKGTQARRSSRRDNDAGEQAFLIRESDSEWLAAEMIAGVTSGEYVGEDARNEVSMDELGGPYVAEAAVVVYD